MTGWLLALAVGLLVANGFFVAVEFALVASRRTKLETMAEEGSRSARLALAASRELSLQLAGAQLGITMASLGLGAVAEPAVARLLESGIDAFAGLPSGLLHTISFILALAIVVFLHMVIGEMVPKNIAIAGPERTIRALAIPNRIYVSLFRPLIRVLNAVANSGVRLMGVEPRDEVATAHTAEELAQMLADSRSSGLVEDFAHQLLSGALHFGERPVSTVTVARERVVVVARSTSVDEAERVAVASGHSRLVISGRDSRSEGRSGPGLADPIGFVHVKDLLTVSGWARERPIPHSRIRQLLVVGAERPLDEVLVAMRRARTHVALVRDRAGRDVGIATLEDVVEAIVGDIFDESDRIRRRAVTRSQRTT